MDCEVGEYYYLKESEIKLLLAGLGVTQLYGIFTEEAKKKLEKEELHKNMAKLYQEDWIDWENGKIAVKKPLSKILSVIEKSRRCIVIYGKSQSVKCCYFTKEQVVMVEKSQREEETLCISYSTMHKWIAAVSEAIEISEGFIDDVCKVQKTEQKFFQWKEDTKIYLEDESIKAVFCLQDSKKNYLYKRFLIQEKGLQTFFIAQSREKTVRNIYYRETLVKNLEKWMREVQA
ncbi:MAG: hypothetical protein ACI4C5_00985 [Lachnospiraceae bacterium]